MLLLFGSVITAGMGRHCAWLLERYRVIMAFKERAVLRRAEARKYREELAATEEPDVPEPLACVICCARRIDCALVPCGHVCSCHFCARRMKECPVCRKAVEQRYNLPPYLVRRLVHATDPEAEEAEAALAEGHRRNGEDKEATEMVATATATTAPESGGGETGGKTKEETAVAATTTMTTTAIAADAVGTDETRGAAGSGGVGVSREEREEGDCGGTSKKNAKRPGAGPETHHHHHHTSTQTTATEVDGAGDIVVVAVSSGGGGARRAPSPPQPRPSRSLVRLPLRRGYQRLRWSETAVVDGVDSGEEVDTVRIPHPGGASTTSARGVTDAELYDARREEEGGEPIVLESNVDDVEGVASPLAVSEDGTQRHIASSPTRPPDAAHRRRSEEKR